MAQGGSRPQYISQVVPTDGLEWQSSVYHRLSRLMAQGGSRPRYITGCPD